MAPKKVLAVLTSHSELGTSGKKTGWYLPEFAHPYEVFTKAGYEVVSASPAGGAAPLDPGSVTAFAKDASSVNFLEKNKDAFEKTRKLGDIAGTAADDFDAIFYVGGHGPMFDLAVDPESQALAARFAEKGKVVSAVCHGPAALVNVKLSSGEPLLKGKKVTAFSNAEEDAVKLSEFMPFPLETKLNEVSGGGFEKAADPWGAHVVVDGKLVTGQNPASATGVAEAVVKLLGD